MIITIDGPAAAGKGTLSSKLAQKYNLAYFDTGMIYRAVGLDLILNNTEKKEVPKKIFLEYILLKNQLYGLCMGVLKLKKILKRK